MSGSNARANQDGCSPILVGSGDPGARHIRQRQRAPTAACRTEAAGFLVAAVSRVYTRDVVYRLPPTSALRKYQTKVYSYCVIPCLHRFPSFELVGIDKQIICPECALTSGRPDAQ